MSIESLDRMAATGYTACMSMRSDTSPESRHTDICLWLDYYLELLSPRQRELLTLYYDEDWSLSEIADHTGLSRQGVHDQIRRGVAKLESLEGSLRLVWRDRQMGTLVAEALASHGRGDQQRLEEALKALWELAGQPGMHQE